MRTKLLPYDFYYDQYNDNNWKHSYESILFQYVNCSKFFRKKNRSGKYIHPDKESNHECDAQGKKYSIDFKLLCGRGLNFELRPRVDRLVEIWPGATVTIPPNHERKDSATVVYLDSLLAENVRPTGGEAKKEFDQVIKVFQTKKNILIYYPFLFYENDLLVREPKALTKELEKRFKWIMKLAKRKRGTFLLVYTPNQFNLFKLSRIRVKYVESIDKRWFPDLWFLKETPHNSDPKNSL